MGRVSATEFLTEYARFEDIPEPVITAKLEFVERAYCPFSAWKARQLDGIKLGCAHLLEMEWLQTAETSGAAATLAAGSGSNPPTSITDDWSLTAYGRQFKHLRDTLIVTGFAF